MEQLPRLRAAAGPLAVAAPGSTDRVALLIEPRCHPALEHVVRNAMHFLGEGWQLQIFHGTENEAFLREIFSADEHALTCTISRRWTTSRRSRTTS